MDEALMHEKKYYLYRNTQQANFDIHVHVQSWY